MTPTGSPAAGDSPDEKTRKWRRHRRFVRAGQVLMIVGALVAIVHWLTHLEAFGPGQPPGWLDLVAGYPAAAVLILAGAILTGKK
ncbi:hypothetical protein ABIB56_001570 [Glaciihabitans sp. UYNi722]